MYCSASVELVWSLTKILLASMGNVPTVLTVTRSRPVVGVLEDEEPGGDTVSSYVVGCR
jgi:hypothetical protein